MNIFSIGIIKIINTNLISTTYLVFKTYAFSFLLRIPSCASFYSRCMILVFSFCIFWQLAHLSVHIYKHHLDLFTTIIKGIKYIKIRTLKPAPKHWKQPGWLMIKTRRWEAMWWLKKTRRWGAVWWMIKTRRWEALWWMIKTRRWEAVWWMIKTRRWEAMWWMIKTRRWKAM